MKPNAEALIEELVQKRKHAKANAAIKVWLKASPSTESKLVASDWLRRLGDFKQAYRLIAPENYHLNRVKAGSIEAKRYLWCARMLNLMGASHFASQIVTRLPAFEEATENRMIANIHLTSFDSASAYIYFKLAEKLDKKPESYGSRMGVIGTCDALSGLKKYNEAIKKIRKIPFADDEQLLRGILLQAEGEYLARSGAYPEALRIFNQAEEFFPEDDQSVDRLFLNKWRAIALLGSKKTKEGLLELNRTILALQKPEYRAEIWLDCLYWKHQFNLASPNEVSLLLDYPGLVPNFKNRYLSYSKRSENRKGENQFWISFSRNEWKLNHQAFHFLPKEIELLGLLKSAAPIGISVTRLATLLWPDEVSSFLHLEGRVQQLLRRLRNQYEIEVQTKNQEVILDAHSSAKITLEHEDEVRPPLIFEHKKSISLEEVQDFYQLKRTQVHHLVNEWIENKLVISKKSGRKVILNLRVI